MEEVSRKDHRSKLTRPISVGKCHAQTAESRFGREGQRAIRDRERISLGSAPQGMEEPFTWPGPGEDDEATKKSVFGKVPSMQILRNNLTALSQCYNLYFVAYQGRIFIYRLHGGPRNRISNEPDLQLKPPASREARVVLSLMNKSNPHTINHMITGFLGDDEIVLACFDDGDVVAYYTKAIARLVFKEPSNMEGNLDRNKNDGTPHKPPPKHALRPFFYENVHKTAWGLAIHRQSRLIAVSTNLKEITVFALAIRPPSSSPSGAIDKVNENFAEIETRVRLRLRNWRIVILLGKTAENIPNIAFLDNTRGFAEKICGIDINGYIWVSDIWKPNQPVYRIRPLSSTDSKSEELRPGLSSRGWGVLALRDDAFMKVKTVEELIGVSAKSCEIRGAGVATRQPIADIELSLGKIPDNPCPQHGGVVAVTRRLNGTVDIGGPGAVQPSTFDLDDAFAPGPFPADNAPAPSVEVDLSDENSTTDVSADESTDLVEDADADESEEDEEEGEDEDEEDDEDEDEDEEDGEEDEEDEGEDEDSEAGLGIQWMDDEMADNFDTELIATVPDMPNIQFAHLGPPGPPQPMEPPTAMPANQPQFPYLGAQLVFGGQPLALHQLPAPTGPWPPEVMSISLSSIISLPAPAPAPASMAEPTVAPGVPPVFAPTLAPVPAAAPAPALTISPANQNAHTAAVVAATLQSIQTMQNEVLVPFHNLFGDWGQTLDQLENAFVQIENVLAKHAQPAKAKHRASAKCKCPKCLATKPKDMSKIAVQKSMEQFGRMNMWYYPSRAEVSLGSLSRRARIAFARDAKPQARDYCITTGVGVEDRLIPGYYLLRTFERDFELLPLSEERVDDPYLKELRLSCVDPMPSHFYRNPSIREFFAAASRLNMLVHVPELSLVALGSPTGRVLLATLTRMVSPLTVPSGQWTWDHGIRPEWILPTKSDESAYRKKMRPLYGLALARVPDSGKGGHAGQATGAMPTSVRYRLMLHYQTHDILSYEISRNDQTGKLRVF